MSLPKKPKLDYVHDSGDAIVDKQEDNIYHSKYFNKLVIPTHTMFQDTESTVPTTEKLPHLPVKFIDIEVQLSSNLTSLSFSKPVVYIYNPIKYAYDVHCKYVHKFCIAKKNIMFLGMNPGPWGMSQTGVPFGEVNVVRDWLDITGTVGHPEKENPFRPVTGFDCRRSEISGQRFWGLFQDLCGEPCNFFRHILVYNYCPVAFMTESGKNITPSELKIAERKSVNLLCDKSLCEVLQLFEVSIIVAIGKFAESRAIAALKAAGIEDIKIEYIPHPSPRNFGRVENWRTIVTQRLTEFNLMQYFSPSQDCNLQQQCEG